MKITRRTAVTAMISATALPLLGGSRAFAQKTIPLTIASSHPLIIPWVGPLKTVIVDKSNALLEERGSEYRIDWTEAFGGTLYNFNETLEAVTTQLTDMGWIGSLFEPASLPLQNIMYSTPFVTQTVAQAINTMNLLNAEQPAMKEEWAKQDIRFFGSCLLRRLQPLHQEADRKALRSGRPEDPRRRVARALDRTARRVPGRNRHSADVQPGPDRRRRRRAPDLHRRLSAEAA